MSVTTKRIIRFVIEAIVILASVVFIVRNLVYGWSTIVEHINHIDFALLAYAWLSFALYFGLRSYGWWLILKIFNAALTFDRSSIIWFLSEFSRYIPGNVWSFASRIYLLDSAGVNKRTTVTGQLLEIILLCGSSIFFVMLFIVLSPLKSNANFAWFGLLFIPIIVLFFKPIYLVNIANWFLRRFKKPELKAKISTTQSLALLVVYIFAWAAYGIGSYFVAVAFGVVGNISTVWLVSVFVTAWLIGYLSFITPMGLGVREAMVVAALGSVTGNGLAGFIAIVSRVWLVFCELTLLYFIGMRNLVGFWRRNRQVINNRELTLSVCPFRLCARRWRVSYLDRRPTVAVCLEIKNWLGAHKPELVLAGLIFAFIVYFVTFSFLRHATFNSAQYDLGIMDQTVWNGAHGRPFQLTNPGATITVSRFSIHADIFLVLLAPLYWIFASPYTLLFVQAVVIGLGALPLYWLGCRVLKNKSLAVLIAFCYLMFPPLERAVIFDFHSVVLASSFIIFAFYFLYIKKYWWFALFAILTLSTKETMSFLVVTMGIYAIVSQKNWRVGLPTIAVGVAWFAALLWYIMPSTRDGSAHFALYYYAKYGSSPGEILKTMIFEPSSWIKDLLTAQQATYLTWFFVPTGLLALLSPVALLAIPEFAINMLSSNQPMHTFFYQYTSGITPFIFIAMIFGVAKIKSITENKWPNVSPKRFATVIIAYVLVFTIFTTWLWSPLPGMQMQDLSAFSAPPAAAGYLNQLAKSIPQTAVVSATTNIAPHFSERQAIYLFPLGIGQADYVITRTGSDLEIKSAPEITKAVADMEKNTNYTSIYKDQDVEVFKKVAS